MSYSEHLQNEMIRMTVFNKVDQEIFEQSNVLRFLNYAIEQDKCEDVEETKEAAEAIEQSINANQRWMTSLSDWKQRFYN